MVHVGNDIGISKFFIVGLMLVYNKILWCKMIHDGDYWKFAEYRAVGPIFSFSPFVCSRGFTGIRGTS